MTANNQSSWIVFDPATSSYKTQDNTSVPSELAETQECLLDVFYISHLREQQRTNNEQQ